jgi:predicted TIM-barrel fold metal-dependent hydrolase
MTERLISADSHVATSHDAVKRHLATKYHDAYDNAMTRMYTDLMYMFEGKNMTNQRKHPASTRAGYEDAAERLKDMDVDGVDVEVLYSEVSAFRFLTDVGEGRDEATRAFNDSLHEWASVDAKRLIVSYQIPIYDVDFAVSEIKRIVELGGKSLQLPVYPSEAGLPEYFDKRYDPMWATIQETGLPVCLHIGLNTNIKDLARRDPTPNAGVMVPIVALLCAESYGMIIMGGVLERFPDLKIVYVEPGVGWLPWWMEVADDLTLRQGYDFPAIKELPSFYFKRNCSVTFIDEATAIQTQRHTIGVENLMWSTDYPHPVSSWPHSHKIVDEIMHGVPADERRLMTSGNAERIWNLA